MEPLNVADAVTNTIVMLLGGVKLEIADSGIDADEAAELSVIGIMVFGNNED